jgi:hypothetical protein
VEAPKQSEEHKKAAVTLKVIKRCNSDGEEILSGTPEIISHLLLPVASAVLRLLFSMLGPLAAKQFAGLFGDARAFSCSNHLY